MNKILVDLCCCAGGASKGYHDAGFDIVGVDIQPQPNYPYEFYQEDAINFIEKHWKEFDAIHISPPCQFATKSSLPWRLAGKEYPNLIPVARETLIKTGKPFVIENVPEAFEFLKDPIILNGSFFGMKIHRTRLFECSFKIPFFLLSPDVKPVKMGRKVKDGEFIQPVGHFTNVDYAREQMGINWMARHELAQAIPPAFTKFIGKYLLEHIETKKPS